MRVHRVSGGWAGEVVMIRKDVKKQTNAVFMMTSGSFATYGSVIGDGQYAISVKQQEVLCEEFKKF
jgi:hypothetical protein